MARNKYDVAQSGLHALSSIATDMAIFSDSMRYISNYSLSNRENPLPKDIRKSMEIIMESLLEMVEGMENYMDRDGFAGRNYF